MLEDNTHQVIGGTSANNIWYSKLPQIEYEYQYLEENIRIFVRTLILI